MECRMGCGACCTHISISSSIPGHIGGKKAGERCINLSSANLCMLWDTPQMPQICRSFKADKEFCGENREEAAVLIRAIEVLTR